MSHSSLSGGLERAGADCYGVLKNDEDVNSDLKTYNTDVKPNLWNASHNSPHEKHTDQDRFESLLDDQQLVDKLNNVDSQWTNSAQKSFGLDTQMTFGQNLPTWSEKRFARSHNSPHEKHTDQDRFESLLDDQQLVDKLNNVDSQWTNSAQKSFGLDTQMTFGQNSPIGSEKHFARKPTSFLHQMVHTGLKPFECPDCEKQFSQKSSLVVHRRTHSGERPYRCPVCQKDFSHKSNLMSHQRIHTGQKPYECHICHKRYSHKSNATTHLKTHDKTLLCSVCKKSFSSKALLKVHQRIHSGEKPFGCSICDKRFSASSTLATHQRIHSGEKPYSCSVCDKRFSLSSSLVTHQRIHSGEKPYRCSVCDKRFSSSSSVVTHQRIHSGEKPYRCSVCGKRFGASSSLITHQRIHSGEKPYRCSVCDKRFSSSSSLVTHQRIHSGEKPYKCSVCDKRFSSSSSLVTHQRIHSGEKPYRCSVCDKRFSSSSSLITHQRIHSGEKPYRCSVCDKGFGVSSSLVIHQRIHSGEKPYSCSLCDKRFTVSSSLISHQRLHTGETPYQCLQCKKDFRYHTALKRHQQEHNSEKPVERAICRELFSENNLTPHRTSLSSSGGNRRFQTHQTNRVANKSTGYKFYKHNTSYQTDPKMQHEIPRSAKPFACYFCGKRFTYKKRLSSHEQQHVTKRRFELNSYKRDYTFKIDPNKREKLLARKKTYKCPICGKLYFRVTHFNIHLRIHTGERPFGCSICKRRFIQKCNLIKHQMTHTRTEVTGGFKHEKTSPTLTDLNEQLKTELVAEPFECNICEQTFSHKQLLVEHIEMHIGSKVMRSDIQDAIFSGVVYGEDLVSHSKATRFKCDSCSEEFNTDAELREHSFIHQRELSPIQDAISYETFPYLNECQGNGELVGKSSESNVGSSHVNTIEEQFKCCICEETFVMEPERDQHLQMHIG